MRYEALHRCDALERALRPQVAVEVVDLTTIFAPASGWAGPPSSSTATTTGASAMPGIPASRRTVISRSSRRRRLVRSRREADDRDRWHADDSRATEFGDGAGARKTCSWRGAGLPACGVRALLPSEWGIQLRPRRCARGRSGAALRRRAGGRSEFSGSGVTVSWPSESRKVSVRSRAPGAHEIFERRSRADVRFRLGGRCLRVGASAGRLDD
jgi:hypothetical protein